MAALVIEGAVMKKTTFSCFFCILSATSFFQVFLPFLLASSFYSALTDSLPSRTTAFGCSETKSDMSKKTPRYIELTTLSVGTSISNSIFVHVEKKTIS